MGGVLIPRTRSVDVRQEGERVVVIENGRAILDLPWDAALELARAITFQAHQAETADKADGLIMDSALLMRVGAPFTLSDNRFIQDAARVEAAWNKKLRRAFAGGVKSREVFGVPRIIRHRPNRKANDHG